MHTVQKWCRNSASSIQRMPLHKAGVPTVKGKHPLGQLACQSDTKHSWKVIKKKVNSKAKIDGIDHAVHNLAREMHKIIHGGSKNTN